MARILAALSGGVDSSVAAGLLVEQGHEVIGVSLQLDDQSDGGAVSRCCSAADLRDARLVCGKIGIPYYVMNEEEAFRRGVLTPFIDAYARGRTPNPCVRCNSTLKFGSLLRISRAVGAERIATGHYARAERDGAGRPRLLMGADRSKDQSYFLFDLDEEQRAAALFPIGALSKPEVQAAAERLGLPVARKPESQDLCFVPDGDVRSYLAGKLGGGPGGEIVDTEGRVLGRHEGIHRFTIGQRRGLGVGGGRPLYVIAIEPRSGRVVVGTRQALCSRALVASGCRLHDPRLLGGPFRAEARIRSRHEGARATVTPLGEGRLLVRFEEPQQAVTPGQAVVLYEGEMVLGGGWIESARELDSRVDSPVDYVRFPAERA